MSDDIEDVREMPRTPDVKTPRDIDIEVRELEDLKPRAIATLADKMTSQDDRVAVSAANSVLDRIPGTMKQTGQTAAALIQDGKKSAVFIQSGQKSAPIVEALVSFLGKFGPEEVTPSSEGRTVSQPMGLRKVEQGDESFDDRQSVVEVPVPVAKPVVEPSDLSSDLRIEVITEEEAEEVVDHVEKLEDVSDPPPVEEDEDDQIARELGL